ncbi:hypothetical protein M8J75_008962 [Diaphorina citri]|nr:hypothetical protein M8J75_008962 [Diaphorina citri]
MTHVKSSVMDQTKLLNVLALILSVISPSLPSSAPSPSSAPHSRQKRLLWITNDGRLALPPGTHLTITPSLSLPFVRYPPDGFLSNMSISLPFTVDFDSLGLTDNQNPFGTLPPLMARSMGRQAGGMLASYVAELLDSGKRRRRTRSTSTVKKPKSAQFHGGERALLYTVVEDLLANFGMDGRACLLRAICEVHAHNYLHRFGLMGEILKLFFTVTKSPYADLMSDYVAAEKKGSSTGECWPYFKECPKSLFQSSSHNKYSENSTEGDIEVEENEIREEEEEEVHADETSERTRETVGEKYVM